MLIEDLNNNMPKVREYNNGELRCGGISVILPVYNEEGNIENVFKSIVGFLPKISREYEIILIDDGSIDATYDIIGHLSRDLSYVKMIHYSKNKGYGDALKSGFEIARFPLIFFMDSDGQFDVLDIEKLIAYVDEYDMVVGVRSVRRDSLYRVILGSIYNKLICILFGIRQKDITCGFKLVKKSVLDVLPLKSGSGFINAEILVGAARKGILIKEVHIRHLPRINGIPRGANIKVFIRKLIEMYSFWWK